METMDLPENTEKTRLVLAVKVVEGWDLDALMGFAIDTLEQTYRMSPVVFDDDWEQEMLPASTAGSGETAEGAKDD